MLHSRPGSRETQCFDQQSGTEAGDLNIAAQPPLKANEEAGLTMS